MTSATEHFFGLFPYVDESKCSHIPSGSKSKYTLHINLEHGPKKLQDFPESLVQMIARASLDFTGWRKIEGTTWIEVGVGESDHKNIQHLSNPVRYPAPDADVIRLRALRLPVNLSSENLAESLQRAACVFGKILSVVAHGTRFALGGPGKFNFAHEGAADVYARTGHTTVDGKRGEIVSLPKTTTLLLDGKEGQFTVPVRLSRMIDLCSYYQSSST